jgi:hypothetical protein
MSDVVGVLSPSPGCTYYPNAHPDHTVAPYYAAQSGYCYPRHPSITSTSFPCEGTQYNSRRICPCGSGASPPPPLPALHALVHHDEFQNGLRFNENVDRTIFLSPDSGLTTGDAVVYVPTSETSCANVLTIAASDGNHGGLLSADGTGDLSTSVNLPRGDYHACVAQQSTAGAPAGRRLQAIGGFGVSDFVLRNDVTLTVDPVDAGSVFACTCPLMPPSAPPTPPPPSLPPPPSPPP